jgi:hypothetical protein
MSNIYYLLQTINVGKVVTKRIKFAASGRKTA